MKLPRAGQATVEYIFILAFAMLIGVRMTDMFSKFFQGAMGGVGHALSSNVTVGVCADDCFFAGYVNGYTGTP
jgi:hypothetical protein